MAAATVEPTGLLARLRDDLQAAACSVAVVEGTELVFVAAVGAGAAEVIGRRIPLSRGIAGWTVVSGQPIAVADVDRHSQFDRATAESTGYVPTSILAVPLDVDDASIGVLEVLDRQPSADDLERASAVASRLALHFGDQPAAGLLDDHGTDDFDTVITRLRAASPATRAAAVAMITELLDVEAAGRGESPIA